MSPGIDGLYIYHLTHLSPYLDAVAPPPTPRTTVKASPFMILGILSDSFACIFVKAWTSSRLTFGVLDPLAVRTREVLRRSDLDAEPREDSNANIRSRAALLDPVEILLSRNSLRGLTPARPPLPTICKLWRIMCWL